MGEGGEGWGLRQRENAALSERVSGLSREVQSLSEKLRRLSTG
ncbi:MbeD/MobD family mobilization/exclusion protein [Klebsiella pneumoniae]